MEEKWFNLSVKKVLIWKGEFCMKIILASKSPRRRELMDLAEFNYEVIPSNVDEVWDSNLTIEENSKNLGYQKAKDIFDNTSRW